MSLSNADVSHPPTCTRYPVQVCSTDHSGSIIQDRHQQGLSPVGVAPSASFHDTESLVRHAGLHWNQLYGLSAAAQRFLRVFSKTIVTLEEVLLQRSQIVHVREQGAQQRHFISESQEVFLREAEALLELSPRDTGLERMHTLHDQVLRDHTRRNEHVKRAQELETQMADREFHLQQRLNRLAEAAKKVFDKIDNMSLPDRIPDEVSTSNTVTSVSEAPETEIPPLVQHYFEKVGDVNTERERLVELESEHMDLRMDRMMRMDQGRRLSMNDDEFEDAFARQYHECELRYQEAVRKSELALAICIGENLSPDNFRRQPSVGGHESSIDVESDWVAAFETASEKAYIAHEREAPTFEPLHAAQSMDLGLSPYPPWPRNRRQTPPPVEERVYHWLEDQRFSNPGGSVKGRERSLSDPKHDVRDVMKALTIDLDQEQQPHGSPSFVRRYVDGSDGHERPVLIQRSSSESELFNRRGFPMRPP